jgi:hypothetical protein
MRGEVAQTMYTYVSKCKNDKKKKKKITRVLRNYYIDNYTRKFQTEKCSRDFS